MQKPVFQLPNSGPTQNGAPSATSSNSTGAAPFAGGCINKKWLFFTLRPYAAIYRAGVVRDFMHTSNRLERCGIDPEHYGQIRIFTAEATAVILADLRQLNFIP